jgi:hypothetical protein
MRDGEWRQADLVTRKEVVVLARDSRRVVGVLALFVVSLVAFPTAAGQAPSGTGWAELSAVAPGTAVVIELNDGRRLERYVVGTAAGDLVVLDLSTVSSDARQGMLRVLRESPQEYFKPVYVSDGESGRAPVGQRFDRETILSVRRPRPLAFEPPKALGWLLNVGGPCPNCDATQTWVGHKPTSLPSPLPAGRSDRQGGDLIYLAPVAGRNALDDVTWVQVKWLLPAGLRAR